MSPTLRRLRVHVGAMLAVLFMTASVVGAPPPAVADVAIPDDSAVRYATKDFVAGWRVRPQSLAQAPEFRLLPIERIVPAPFSIRRLATIGVEELVIFAGRAPQGSGDSRDADVRWAAVARMASPVDLSQVMRQWHESPVYDARAGNVARQRTKLGEHDCLEFPAGTFIPPARRRLPLRFTDRKGRSAEHGINVGKFNAEREYIEGDSAATATFLLSRVSAADFEDGRLRLELRPDVFLTRRLDREFATMLVSLRNPKTGLASEPARLDAKSYELHEVSFPRELKVLKAGQSQPADLLKELVSDGRLEVVIRVEEAATYLGVGPSDLNLRPRRSEYVVVMGQTLVIATSKEVLERMLQAKAEPVPLARRLLQPDADVSLAVELPSAPPNDALARLLFGDFSEAVPALRQVKSLDAAFAWKKSTMAHVVAEFPEERMGPAARAQFLQWMASAQATFRDSVLEPLRNQDALGNLVQLALGGVSMKFPDPLAVSDQSRAIELAALLANLSSGVRVGVEGAAVTVDVPRPAQLDRLSDTARIALANWAMVRSTNLMDDERFDLVDEAFEYSTDRFPSVPEAWFRRAHHLAYNASAEFEGSEPQYAWVRRGIESLLDGIERNPKNADFHWMAARVIGWKLGEADNRRAFRERFARDEALHKRLARWVDLGQASSPDQPVDSWLVALLLMDRGLEVRGSEYVESSIEPVIFVFQSASVRAGYAAALTEAGHWEGALAAWKQAEKSFRAVGERSIAVSPKERFRLDDFATLRAKLGPRDESVKRLDAIRNFVRYPYWLARCQFEQNPRVQDLRRQWANGESLRRRGQWPEAYDEYRRALIALEKVLDPNQPLAVELAGDFLPLSREYHGAAARLKRDDPAPRVLELIHREPDRWKKQFQWLDEIIK